MKDLWNIRVPRVTQAQIRLTRRLMPLGICCLVSVWLLPGECRASSLYVGNFFGNQSDVLLYNGDTGAFIGTFVPHGSGSLTFPLGGGFGPDGNFYVSN